MVRHVEAPQEPRARALEHDAKAAFGFTRSKREGEDMEAIVRLFAPEFRNRLDAIKEMERCRWTSRPR